MTKQEAYDKWKHLDQILSNEDFCLLTPVWCLAYDLWQILKEEMAEEKTNQKNDTVM